LYTSMVGNGAIREVYAFFIARCTHGHM
jgi:hypothetical protein